jgi:hypothetical protein
MPLLPRMAALVIPGAIIFLTRVDTLELEFRPMSRTLTGAIAARTTARRRTGI